VTDADRVQFVREVWARAYLEGCDPLEALNTLEREAKARLATDPVPMADRVTLPAPCCAEKNRHVLVNRSI